MDLGNRLKKIRKYLDLSQVAFAESIGMKQGSYSDVERGRNKGFSKTTIDNIAKNYNSVNIEWLLTGEGDMIKPISPTGQTNIGSGLLVGHGNRNLNISSGVNIQTLEEWKLREATLLSQIESLKKEVQHLNDLLSSKNEIIELLKSK